MQIIVPLQSVRWQDTHTVQQVGGMLIIRIQRSVRLMGELQRKGFILNARLWTERNYLDLPAKEYWLYFLLRSIVNSGFLSSQGRVRQRRIS